MSVATENTPDAESGVAITNPALLPGLATPSSDTKVQFSSCIADDSPELPVNNRAILVRSDRDGSAANVPSAELCSTETDIDIRQPFDEVINSNSGV